MKTTSAHVAQDSQWNEKAYLALCDYLDGHIGEEHVGEEIRAALEAIGVPTPQEKRAWGPVLKRAEKNGLLKNVGYAPTKSSNGSPKVLWAIIGENAGKDTLFQAALPRKG
jgi:hypothetical protein